MSGPRVMMPIGVRAFGQCLDRAAGQAEAALGGLVRVRRRADDDLLALPRLARQFTPEDLDEVGLDADRRAVARVGRPVGDLLERPDEAERALVDAAHVRVERPLEAHVPDAVQGGAAGLVAVCRPHGRKIEHPFLIRPTR